MKISSIPTVSFMLVRTNHSRTPSLTSRPARTLREMHGSPRARVAALRVIGPFPWTGRSFTAGAPRLPGSQPRLRSPSPDAVEQFRVRLHPGALVPLRVTVHEHQVAAVLVPGGPLAPVLL